MAKVKSEVVENEVNEVSEVEATETVSNIVELSNGEKVNFGKNGKVISTYDVASNEITFKVVDGSVISFNVADLPAEVVTEAVLFGLREKIKNTLSPVKPEDTAAKIVKEIENLKNGKFVTRSSDSGSVELDDFMTAFAMINATGTITTPTGSFDIPEAIKADVVTVDALKPHWVNVKETSVINEVLAHWDTLDRKVKSSQRQNGFLKTQVQMLALLG